MNEQLSSTLSRFVGIISLLFCSANLIAQTCTGNLLTNPGFENGLTGWNTTGDVTISTSAHSGTKAAKVGGTGYGSVGFILPATAGTAYTAKVWAKQSGSAYKVVELRFLNSSWTALPGGAGTDIPSSSYTERTMTGTAPAGTAYVYVIGSKDGNGTLEVDDWCLTSGGGGGGQPDLTVSNAVVSPTSAAPGSNITVTLTTGNIGTSEPPANSSNLSFYLSTDNALSSNDVVITGGPQANNPIGTFPNTQFMMAVPAGTAAGSYFIIAKIDALNAVTESNENNNTTSVPFTVTGTPPPADQGCFFEKLYTTTTGLAQGRGIFPKENANGTFSVNVVDWLPGNTFSLRNMVVDAAGEIQTPLAGGAIPTNSFSVFDNGYLTFNGSTGNQFTIRRYNLAGVQQWEKTYTMTGVNTLQGGLGMAKVSDGFIFSGIVNKPGLPTNEFYPFFLKTNDLGVQVWQKVWNTTTPQPGTVRLLDEAVGGGYYFDIPLTIGISSNFTKVDANGNKVWEYSLGGGTSFTLHSASDSPDGQSVYVATSGSAQAPQSPSVQYVRFYRLNANGSLVWGDLIPTSTVGLGLTNASVLATNDGAVIAFESNNAGTDRQFHYRKLDLSGNQVWAKTKANRTARIVQKTSDGGLLFAGTDFGSPQVPYLLKTTANGNETPVCQGGGPCAPDVTPPVISGCPANIATVTASNSIVVNWTPPTATDNCGGSVSLTSTHNPGSQFMLGSTTVTYTATDAAGNAANCVFNVFVGQEGTGQIDLSLTLQQLTASPAQWSNYPVKLTISNAGPQTATGVKVKFAKPTGVVYVGGNQFTASQGTFNPNGDEVWTVGSIPANGSATLTVNYFLLNATAPVAYAQVTAANETDSDSQPNNGTPPTPVQDDEASTAGGTTPTLPDITISTVTSPPGGTVAAGAAYSINFVPTNPGGTIPAAQLPVTGRFYLSVDNVLSANDILVGTSANVPINGTPQSISGTVPANTAAGQYYAIVQLDPANTVTESNENNNVAASALTITVTGGSSSQPDLTIADLQIPTASVVAGAILSYNFDASNAGTAAVPGNFTIKSYISTDQTLSANDVQDGNINTGNYAAGFSVQNVPGASTIPANLAAGQYYLIVKIDGDNAIAEGNENNNTVVKPFTVTAPNTGGNCETVLSPEPMVCARPLTNGNIEVGTGVQVYFSPYKLFEYGANGSLVNDTPDPTLLTIPAFVTIIQNGNSIATVETATGAVSGVTPIPASITSTITNLVVCSQAGTSNYFLAGTRTSDNRVVVMLLNGTANLISTFNTNAGGFANSIVPTSWGGAILGRTDNGTSQFSPAGTLYAISATNTMLYSVSKNEGGFLLTKLPCGTDAFRVASGYNHVALGIGRQYAVQDDYQFTQTAAQLMRTRRIGKEFNQPVFTADVSRHIFPNADGSKWRITRFIAPASAPVYGFPGMDSMYYEKLSATDQVLLSQPLDKTKFDALNDIQIYAVAEVQPGKLAFFGNKGGAAWYYNPFCGGTPPPPTGDCSTITITPGVGKITIAGFSAPHVLIKVFKPNWTVAYECLDGQCATPTVITGLGTGSHYVEVKLMNATWGEICKKTQTVGVTNIAQQDDDRLRLAFDKFYPNPTAYQTTMELYSPIAQQATLDFYDRTGRLVHTQKVELEQGQNLIEQLVFDWKSGTYNVVARGEKSALPAYGRFLKVWEE